MAVPHRHRYHPAARGGERACVRCGEQLHTKSGRCQNRLGPPVRPGRHDGGGGLELHDRTPDLGATRSGSPGWLRERRAGGRRQHRVRGLQRQLCPRRGCRHRRADLEKPLDDGVESLSGVVDGALYVGSYGSVHALDAGTGEQLWMAAMPETVGSVSAGEEGAVYAASLDGYIYALDADSGDRVWKFNAWFPPHRSTAVADGLLYVSSHDRLYALDARTGAQVWKTMIEDRPDPSPAVADGVVYVGSSNALHALDAATGHRLWKTEFEEDTWVSSPVVSDGVVYMSSAGPHLYAVDAETGQLLWLHAAGHNFRGLAPVVANGLVYAGSANAYLHAVVASAPR